MAKLEDVLKAQGFTDADLESVQTLLGDARLRGAIESHASTLESNLAAFKDENDKWAQWAETTNKPKLESLERERIEALAKAGSLEARVAALDPNYKPGDIQPPAPERRQEPTIEHDKFLTKEEFNRRLTEYAGAEGIAIAKSNDLAAEYRRLTGQDMLDYRSQTPDGRSLYGMEALLDEARRSNKLLPDYISQKFDFAGKRAQAEQAAKAAHDEAMRKEGYQKAVAEMANPNTRPGMPSAQPFIPARTGEAAKMPWETSPAERRNARIQRAVENNVRNTVQ